MTAAPTHSSTATSTPFMTGEASEQPPCHPQPPLPHPPHEWHGSPIPLRRPLAFGMAW